MGRMFQKLIDRLDILIAVNKKMSWRMKLLIDELQKRG